MWINSVLNMDLHTNSSTDLSDQYYVLLKLPKYVFTELDPQPRLPRVPQCLLALRSPVVTPHSRSRRNGAWNSCGTKSHSSQLRSAPSLVSYMLRSLPLAPALHRWGIWELRGKGTYPDSQNKWGSSEQSLTFRPLLSTVQQMEEQSLNPADPTGCVNSGILLHLFVPQFSLWQNGGDEYCLLGGAVKTQEENSLSIFSPMPT